MPVHKFQSRITRYFMNNSSRKKNYCLYLYIYKKYWVQTHKAYDAKKYRCKPRLWFNEFYINIVLHFDQASALTACEQSLNRQQSFYNVDISYVSISDDMKEPD